MFGTTRQQRKLDFGPKQDKINVDLFDHLRVVYENIPSMDPALLEDKENLEQIDQSHRLDKSWITCVKCSRLALNPMQCQNFACKLLTCEDCVKGNAETRSRIESINIVSGTS